MADTTAVTGATGLIGRALVTALAERGHGVVVLARDPGRAREQVPGAADYLRFDLDADGQWQDALADVDHVVNLAGASLFRPFTGRRYLRKVTRERIDGARRIAAALRAAPARARTLVNASSVGVYGFGKPTDGLVDETTAPIAGEYARGSREWETAAKYAEPEVRVVLMRLGFVLAPDGGAAALPPRHGRRAMRLPATRRAANGELRHRRWSQREVTLNGFLSRLPIAMRARI